MAGLNVLDIINEPIAAALSYGMQSGGQNKEEIILVYDLGGGTFDVSVIQVGKDGVKILVTGGKNDLGGKNWDDRLITYLASKFEEENGVNPLTDAFAHQELRTKGEIAKKSLTSKGKIPFTFAFAGFKWRLEVEREKFEEITADLLDLTIQVTHETLDALQGKTGNRKIDRFFLVGGSSRMPMVKARVDPEFGVDSEKYDPDECVAKGAALWGVKRKIDVIAQEAGYDIQTGEGNKGAFDKVLGKELEGVKNVGVYKGLTIRGKTWGNVSSHTYGIKAWDGDVEIVVPLLTQNTAIPYTYESGDGQFGTMAANQKTIDLTLMEAEGESLDPAFCKEIGSGIVELPPGVPKGSEVKIYFDYQGDGTIKLRAREVSSNRECEVKLTRAGVMDVAEVEQAGSKLSVMTAK
jgi:molecular chaperone DnaK (HSP70)